MARATWKRSNASATATLTAKTLKMLWRRSVRKASLRCSVANSAVCSTVVRVLSKAKETIRLSCVNAGVVTRVKFARSRNAQ